MTHDKIQDVIQCCFIVEIVRVYRVSLFTVHDLHYRSWSLICLKNLSNQGLCKRLRDGLVSKEARGLTMFS